MSEAATKFCMIGAKTGSSGTHIPSPVPLQETLSEKRGDEYYKWGVDRQDFPVELLKQVWEKNMTYTWNQIAEINRTRREDEKIRSVTRRAAGSLIVLCDTKYDTLQKLDRHIELAHTGNGGLADLSRVLVVDSSSVPQDTGPPYDRGAIY